MASEDFPDLPLSPERWRAIKNDLHLPPQQARIVELILRDCCDKQIAAEMDLKVPTIRTYLERVFERLGVGNRMGLVLYIFALSQSDRHRRQ